MNISWNSVNMPFNLVTILRMTSGLCSSVVIRCQLFSSAFSISLPKRDLVSFFEQFSNTSAWGKLLDIVGHGRTWSYSFCSIEPLDGF